MIKLLFSLFIVSQIFADSSIRLGAGKSVPPYIISETEGVDIDIVKESFGNINKTIKVNFFPIKRKWKALNEGKIDAIFTAKEDVFPSVDFHLSKKYIVFQNMAITLKRRNIKIRDIRDLRSLSIVAFQNAKRILGNNFRRNIKLSPQYIEVTNQEQQIKMLYAGHTDVIIADVNIFKYFQNEVYRKDDLISQVDFHRIFPRSKYGLAFKDKKLRDEFNKGLDKALINRVHDRVMKKYKLK